jgi:TolB-like protein
VLAQLVLLLPLIAEPPKGKLLVLEPSASKVDGRLTLAVTSALAEAAASASGRSVITMLDVKDVLAHDEAKSLVACDNEERCRDSLKKLNGVELLISATIGPVGKSMTLSLALLDAASAIAKARAATVVEDPEQLPKAVRDLVPELFKGTDASKGTQHFEWKKKQASIAVFDLVASGVPAETATNLTQILAVEVKKVPGTKVIARDDIRAVLNLEAQKQLLGCSDSTACLAEIGGALGVDYLLSGVVGRIADTHVISLRLIDPSTLDVKSRISDSFVGPEDQLVGAIRLAVGSLFGIPIKENGQLTVAAGEGEGSVFLDGASAGLVSQPIKNVAPGRHTLRIVDPGFLEWKGEVFVQPGPNELTLTLEQRPTRFYQSWIFWTSVGLAAVAGGAAIAISAKHGDTTYPFGFQVGLPKR